MFDIDIGLCCYRYCYRYQDTCSEVAPPTLQSQEQELIISCRRQQQQHHQQQQLHQQQHQQQQPQLSKPVQPTVQKVITRSQSSTSSSTHAAVHQLKQQQSLPNPLPQLQQPTGESYLHSHPHQHHNHQHPSKSVSILVYKTLNTVFKSSRKIIVRVCEVASAKKSFTMFKFNKAAQQQRLDNRASAVTGHDQFVRPPVPEKWVLSTITGNSPNLNINIKN